MAQQPNLSVQNNFIAGLKTQFTGLNYPENASPDSQNVIYTLIGDVTRRAGFDYEANYTQTTTPSRTNAGIVTYKWNNVGGDGQTQVVVTQVGSTLYFYQSTNATISSPLSTTLLTSTVSLTGFVASGGSLNSGLECQFADGNGFLFVFHPSCDPFYCTFTPGSPPTITGQLITIQIRDLNGVYPESGNPAFNSRPISLSNEHNYNLQNQGWTAAALWSTQDSFWTTPPSYITEGGTNYQLNTGNQTFTVPSGISQIAIGQPVVISAGGGIGWTNGGVNYVGGWVVSGSGSVVSYSGTSLVINITSATNGSIGVGSITSMNGQATISESNQLNTISTFYSGTSLYPSNADIWYLFKNTSNVFDPAHTYTNVSLPQAPSARGHFILSAFKQQRSSISGVSSITDITTTVRPRTGCWFQGRVFYSGVDASQTATGDEPYYTWTENIYFSQIITDITQFGYCYQENDPTDENFFDILSSDGGVITIQGSGAIYKLFPVQNGLLVFAANGIWFITGSTGIGFSATDYTITKISGVQSISATSYINVLGYPVFWNEEGIYSVTPAQNGILQVENIALDTILNFYQGIPLQSKKFARGDYNPIEYTVQWIYKSTNEVNLTDRYQYDTILTFNIKNRAFYYYTINPGVLLGGLYMHDIKYVAGPGGSTSPAPVFKYFCSFTTNDITYYFTFAEERDTTHYLDWWTQNIVNGATTGTPYTSYFVAGYQLHGKAYAKWQPLYLYLFLRNQVQNSYSVQGHWEFAISGNSGKFSTQQTINDNTSTANFAMKYHRYKIRGRGLVFQLKVTSVPGKPFDVMGWSMFEEINQGV